MRAAASGSMTMQQRRKPPVRNEDYVAQNGKTTKQRKMKNTPQTSSVTQSFGTGSVHDESSMGQSRIQEDEEESKHMTSNFDDEGQGQTQSEDIETNSSEDEDDDDILIKPKDLIVSRYSIVIVFIKSLNSSFFLLQFQSDMNERKWLRTRGKGHMIDFQDDELKKLQQCFTSLVDDEKSESIGVDELEDPLIALGLVDNRQQVQ